MEIEKHQDQKSGNSSSRDFRHVLQDELTARCARNPNYSLRSFAKSLSVPAATLSEILNGKRPVTDKMKERLGFQLGLSLDELKSLKSKPHGNTKLSERLVSSIRFQPVAIDVFSVISEPYHYALLELMKTRDFTWDAKWIAHRLNLTVSEAKIAIERLERVGLLERDSSGNLVDATNGFRSDIREGLSSEGQRRAQVRSHELAIAAIRSISIELRDNTSMTMAVSVGDLPRAKKLIKEFRRRFCVDLESNPKLNEVYQLSISFIPLSKPKITNLKRGAK